MRAQIFVVDVVMDSYIIPIHLCIGQWLFTAVREQDSEKRGHLDSAHHHVLITGYRDIWLLGQFES